MERPAERPVGDLGSKSRGESADALSETPRSGPRRLIELSHQIHHGMVTYPGLPGPELSDYLPREASPARYGPGTEFHIGRISMVANTGTYLDSPFHRFAGATDVPGLPLPSVADLDGVVVRIGAGRRAIDRDALASYDVGGRAVLVHTGWDRYWGTERYGTDGPSSPLLPPTGWPRGGRDCRHRLGQHRRYQRPVASGAYGAAGGWHRDGGASIWA
jgi:hypothetical protein